MKIIVFFLKYYLKIKPIYVFVYLFHIVISAGFNVLNSIYLLRFVFDAFESQNDVRFILLRIFHIVFFDVLVMLFNRWFNDIYSKKIELEVKEEFQKDIFKQAFRINLRYYDDSHFYNEYMMVIEKSDNICESVLKNLGRSLYNFLVFSSIVSLLFTIDVSVVSLIILSVVISFLIDILITKKQTEKEMKNLKYQREVEYFKRVFYLKDHLEEIKSIRETDFLFDQFIVASKNLLLTNKKSSKPIIKLYMLKGIIESFLSSFAIYLVLLYKLVVNASISIGDLSASLNSIWKLSEQLMQIIENIKQLYSNIIFGRKIQDFLNIRTLDTDIKGNSIEFPEHPSSLTVKNLSYSYDGRKTVLRNIDFEIKPNQKIAIVGENGSGKSTLVKLILGLYDNYNGEILLNNIPINNYNFSHKSTYFSCLFQDFQIYSTTLVKNLFLDDLNHNSDTDKINEVLIKVGMDNKIKSLNKGLDTVLTKEYDEEGVELSLGEKQKIALARVLLSHASVIILDEPSSSFDPLSEQKFNEILSSSFSDRIVIFISHRFLSTKNADCIYLLSDGEIIEKGTHIELMEMDGKYAHMYKIQKEKYSL